VNEPGDKENDKQHETRQRRGHNGAVCYFLPLGWLDGGSGGRAWLSGGGGGVGGSFPPRSMMSSSLGRLGLPMHPE
jgi:hypothetical protein